MHTEKSLEVFEDGDQMLKSVRPTGMQTKPNDGRMSMRLPHSKVIVKLGLLPTSVCGLHHHGVTHLSEVKAATMKYLFPFVERHLHVLEHARKLTAQPVTELTAKRLISVSG